MGRHEFQSGTGARVVCFGSMGSFFKNLLKSNNQTSEKGEKSSSSKWLFMFKKPQEQSEQNANIIGGQEDNQGRLRNSNTSLSPGSIALSDKSLVKDGPLLLPKLKRNNFNVPRFIPPNDWIRSQLFEVSHLISCFIDLISLKSASSAKNMEIQLEQIISLIDDRKSDLKQIFVTSFGLISCIYKHEINLLMELKLESHLNSIICQLIELCSQLPGNSYLEVIDSFKAQDDSVIDFSVYKRALSNLESQSISRSESNTFE